MIAMTTTASRRVTKQLIKYLSTAHTIYLRGISRLFWRQNTKQATAQNDQTKQYKQMKICSNSKIPLWQATREKRKCLRPKHTWRKTGKITRTTTSNLVQDCKGGCRREDTGDPCICRMCRWEQRPLDLLRSICNALARHHVPLCTCEHPTIQSYAINKNKDKSQLLSISKQENIYARNIYAKSKY